MKRIFLTLALLLAPAAASAQCNGVFPNGTICGNITGTPNLPRPVSNSALTGVPGGTNGQIQYNNNGNFGGLTFSGDVTGTTSGVLTIQPGVVTTGKIATNGVSNINLSPGPANSVKGSLNGTTTSDLAVASCSAIYQFTQWLSGTGWQCGINPVLPSRAVAAGLNLSAFTSVRTLGYTTPGDGGGATFVKTAAVGFNDSTILTGTISNAGSGCTNGTYNGIPLTGGSGVSALVNVVVSGNIVTTVTSYTPNGNGYIVGDVLGIPSSIGCSGATWTVASVLTATGSFTDASSNKFQIVTDAGNFPNVRQFGAKVNWVHSTGDAGATDDSAAFKSGLAFTNYGIQSIANGGSNGGTLQMPSGTSLVCSTLTIPVGVDLNGAGPFASVIKQCDSSTTASVNLGDPNSGIACFGPRLSNIQIFMGSGTPSSGIAAIFTNCAQQQYAVDHVVVYANKYECFRAVTGLGGASSLTLNDFFCTVNSASVDGIGIHLAYGAAVTTLTNTIVESGSAFTGFGINIAAGGGGVFNIDGFHCEQVSTCINWAPTSSGAIGEIRHASGGASAGCATVVLRQNTAIANQLRMASITPNGCTATYTNVAAATTGNVVTPVNM